MYLHRLAPQSFNLDADIRMNLFWQGVHVSFQSWRTGSVWWGTWCCMAVSGMTCTSVFRAASAEIQTSTTTGASALLPLPSTCPQISLNDEVIIRSGFYPISLNFHYVFHCTDRTNLNLCWHLLGSGTTSRQSYQLQDRTGTSFYTCKPPPMGATQGNKGLLNAN